MLSVTQRIGLNSLISFQQFLIVVCYALSYLKKTVLLLMSRYISMYMLNGLFSPICWLQSMD